MKRILNSITLVMFILGSIGFAAMAVWRSPELQEFVPQSHGNLGEPSRRIEKIIELTSRPGWNKDEATVREVERWYDELNKEAD